MKGMNKAALEEFQLAIQLDSKFDAVLNNWAISLAQETRFLEAKAKLEEAVNLNPLSAILRSNLGIICLLLGQFDVALKELEKAYSLDAESNAIILNLADIYYLKGRVEEAIKLYKQIGKHDLLAEVLANRLQFKTC
jgi:Flp pilus assembly protein TadD